MTWENLQETDVDGVRHCTECDESVSLCLSPEEFVLHANAKQCVCAPTEVDPINLDGH